MILTQTIRKLIYLFVLIPNIIIKSPLYCSYICQKIRFLIENTKKIVENLQAISKLRNTIAELALSKAVSSLTTIVLARLLHAVPSRTKKTQLCCWRRPLMVRQPYSEAV